MTEISLGLRLYVGPDPLERQLGRALLGVARQTAKTGGDADELCAMVDGSYQCTIVLSEDCLGYGLVVPFLAYRFALWFRIMKT